MSRSARHLADEITDEHPADVGPSEIERLAPVGTAGTGQRLTFLATAEDSGGRLVRMDSYNPPGPFEPVHVHPSR